MIVTYDTRSAMYTCIISSLQRDQALEEYNKEFHNTNIINSKTVYNRKESRIAGILGEIVFKELYPTAVKPIYDLTYDFDYNNYKVDVKCKIRSVSPTLDFEASFFEYQGSSRFNADMYYFMSTTKTYEKVWLCGWGTKDYILNHKNMELWKAGEMDSSNGMKFRENTYCLKYKYLNRTIPR